MATTKLTQAQFEQIKAKNQGLKKLLKAKTGSIATKGKSLVSVSLNDSVADAVKLLTHHKISSLPVFDSEVNQDSFICQSCNHFSHKNTVCSCLCCFC